MFLKDEARYSRAYVSELAAQFREQELVLSIKLKGYGMNFQIGFGTDISESCIWMAPFIKEPGDMWDLRTMVPYARNGLQNGLRLVVDTEAYDYTVSPSNGEGWVLSLGHHLDIPIMKNIGINLQPGNDIQIAVTPTMLRTKKGAKRRFDPVRRQCYFEEEISLAHFPVEDSYRYEMSNCLFEATLQTIESVCNCTPKYFVVIADGFEACEGKQKKCMNHLLTQIGDKRTIIHNGETKPCLAACEDQTFKLMIAQAAYPNEESFPESNNFCLLIKKLEKSCNGDRKPVLDLKYPQLCSTILKQSDLIKTVECEEYQNLDEYNKKQMPTFGSEFEKEVFVYARRNLAKIQIYIKDPYVSLYLTEEKFTEMAFVGSLGGVLGLFLGFSFISSVEIVFIFCLRPLFRKKSKREETAINSSIPIH